LSIQLDWNDKEFKSKLLDDLERRGETVGKYVETDARRRLHDITEPQWGRGYRQEIVSRLLTYVVTRTAKEVTIMVGVAKSHSGDHHGYYIELGSSTAPAQPFLRPAVFQNGRNIIGILEG
jgi:hypothetical protein